MLSVSCVACCVMYKGKFLTGFVDQSCFDFGYVLGPPWEFLWGPFGHKFVILYAPMACRIRKLFFMDLNGKDDLVWEAACTENIVNTLVFTTFASLDQLWF